MPRTCDGGVIVHDHFKSYYGLTSAAHGLCNAHHLRELKALIEMEREPWAGAMSDLLRAANTAVHTTQQAGAAALPNPELQRILAQYDAILAEGLALHAQQTLLVRRPGARGRAPRRNGATVFANLRSVISIAGKHGLNILKTLTTALPTLVELLSG